MHKLENYISEYLLNIFEKRKQTTLEYLIEKRGDWLNDNVIKKIDGLDKKLSHLNKAFYKDICLKFIINDMINDKNDEVINKWIVSDWGGIKTHKDFETLKNSMNIQSFDRISSWSKIASFKNIKDNVIYDSRVIYSLNWMIFRFNKKYNTSNKYFFQPSGRNKLLTLLPVDSIINFDNRNSLDVEKKGDKVFNDIYFEKSECYSLMCQLVKNLNKIVFNDVKIENTTIKAINAKDYPFFMEMLLFQIADDIIFEDIKNSITVSIIKE